MYRSELVAGDVARSVSRLLAAMGLVTVQEFPLGSGRRADVAGLDDRGAITLVEIKVSVADLRGDGKWTTYLDYCDRFFFAVPHGFPLTELTDDPRVGVIVADLHEAAVIRSGAVLTLAGARRKAETLRFARKAAARLQAALDPDWRAPTGWL